MPPRKTSSVAVRKAALPRLSESVRPAVAIDAPKAPVDLSGDPNEVGGLIAKTAYRLWEERGREHGRDLDDWLAAERIVRGGN